MKYRSSARPERVKSKPPVGSGEWLTAPDKALSVKEIHALFTSGRPLPEVKNLVYSGETPLPDIRTLDLVDRQRLLDYAKNEVVDLQKKVKEKMALRAKDSNESKDKMKALIAFYDQHKDTIGKENSTEPA